MGSKSRIGRKAARRLGFRALPGLTFGFLILGGLSIAAPAGSQTTGVDAMSIPPEALGVSQVVTAAQLADWGRARGDAGALIMAARLLAEVPVRPAAGEEAPSLTTNGLLDEATALSDGSPGVLAAIARLRPGTGRADDTRGVRSSPFGQGPIVMVREIKARETYGFDVEARGGEVLRVAAIGDGDTNIDMAVRDAAGAVVCRDGFGDHYPVCTMASPRAGKMRIDIVNRGAIWTKVQILSN